MLVLRFNIPCLPGKETRMKSIPTNKEIVVRKIVLAILFYDPSHPKERTCISLLLLRGGSSLWGLGMGGAGMGWQGQE